MCTHEKHSKKKFSKFFLLTLIAHLLLLLHYNCFWWRPGDWLRSCSDNGSSYSVQSSRWFKVFPEVRINTVVFYVIAPYSFVPNILEVPTASILYWMEAACSFETPVPIYETVRCQNPENYNLNCSITESISVLSSETIWADKIWFSQPYYNASLDTYSL